MQKSKTGIISCSNYRRLFLNRVRVFDRDVFIFQRIRIRRPDGRQLRSNTMLNPRKTPVLDDLHDLSDLRFSGHNSAMDPVSRDADQPGDRRVFRHEQRRHAPQGGPNRFSR